MDRKQFLKYAFQGSAISLSLPSLLYCNSNAKSSSRPNPDFIPDLDVELTSVPGSSEILPGSPTDVYRYETRIISGHNDQITQLPGTYLGPVFMVKNKEKIRVRYKNQLPRESIIHWHGLHVPPEMDGHPMYAVKKGEEYIYEFTVDNPPGTYWFHPHPDKITGPQVYGGLAGLFIVEEESVTLPEGRYDVPVVIQDRIFNDNNQLVYTSGDRMIQMQGFLGDVILINGKLSKKQEVERTAYRFRVLNGSNSRIYKLGWSDNSPVTVIATDGGLLQEAIDKPYLMLSPGERVELWKDFSGYKAGSRLVLKSLSFRDGAFIGMGRMGGMMGGMGMTGRGIPSGRELDLLELSIADMPANPKDLSGEMAIDYSEDPANAVNASAPRKFHFYNEHMQWVINGRTFRMHAVADWEKVKEGSTEIWQFINGDEGRGMGMMQNMMKMPHPVHIHGFSFRIIERDVSSMERDVWETVQEGFLDEGNQDTFLLMPGMKVKVLLSFRDFRGKYIYHCHNLEHEDMGMMRNFEIVD